MIPAKDGFKLDIVLSHTVRDPATFTEALLLEPDFAWMKDARMGTQVVMQSARWHARLVSGVGEEDYKGALEKAASFLNTTAQFFRQFRDEDGMAELVMNYAIEPDEGKVLEVSYSPVLLRLVVDLGIWLRVQAWNGEF